MILNYISRLIVQNDGKTKIKLLCTRMSRTYRNEDARARAINTVTLTMSKRGGSPCVIHGKGSRMLQSRSHDYQPAWQFKSTGIATASCCMSHVRNIRYCHTLLVFSNGDEISLAVCAVFANFISRKHASCSCT